MYSITIFAMDMALDEQKARFRGLIGTSLEQVIRCGFRNLKICDFCLLSPAEVIAVLNELI
jgi:hypothetical protein